MQIRDMSQSDVPDVSGPALPLIDPAPFPNVHTARSGNIPAVCVSIDRFLQNRTPICCLPFDGIGVRHPGNGRFALIPAGRRLGFIA